VETKYPIDSARQVKNDENLEKVQNFNLGIEASGDFSYKKTLDNSFSTVQPILSQTLHRKAPDSGRNCVITLQEFEFALQKYRRRTNYGIADYALFHTVVRNWP
jgi:hypothetical protein